MSDSKRLRSQKHKCQDCRWNSLLNTSTIYCWMFLSSHIYRILSLGCQSQDISPPTPNPILTHTEREGNANIYKKHRAFMLLPPWFSSYVRSLAINKKGLCVSCYCYSTRGQESCMCFLAFSQIYRTVMESLFSLAAYTSDYRWQRPTRLDQHFWATQKVTCESRKVVLNKEQQKNKKTAFHRRAVEYSGLYQNAQKMRGSFLSRVSDIFSNKIVEIFNNFHLSGVFLQRTINVEAVKKTQNNRTTNTRKQKTKPPPPEKPT